MNKHIGSSFDDFLEDENIYIDANAEALKRVLAWQILKYIEEQNLTKSDFASKMKTSRSQLDRLLDPDNTNVSLKALVCSAKAMGKHVEIRIID